MWNLLGQKVATLVNRRQNSDDHQVKWDKTGLSSGIYSYKIEVANFIHTRKMIYLK